MGPIRFDHHHGRVFKGTFVRCVDNEHMQVEHKDMDLNGRIIHIVFLWFTMNMQIKVHNVVL